MARSMLLLLVLQTFTGCTVSQTSPASTLPIPPVRLVDSESRCSGRVEIFHIDRWGTVCDDIWDLNDAQVVCRQLGCGSAVSTPKQAYFGQGTGQIWLDDLECSGNELSITDCAHGGLGSHSCGHAEDAGVICEGSGTTIYPTPAAPTPPGAPVRLVDSNSSCSGRVEIFHNNQWGTVCDDIWGLTHAQVVCQQLGCGTAVSAPKWAYFGEGSGPIWLDNVMCLGNESSITDCRHQDIGFHNCDHNEDAGVICEGMHYRSSTTPPAPMSPVRLVHPNSSCSGRVEIYHDGQWGTVCDDMWGATHAQVVCRQMGCGNAMSASYGADFGQGNGPVWLYNVQCSGNESSITECAHQGYGSQNCHHGKDAGVICEEPHSLLQAAQLVCSPNQLEVSVPLDSLMSAGLNAYSGHLAAPYCTSYRVHDNTVCYQVARRAGTCGTLLMTNTTHAIYSNSLFFYPLNNDYSVLPEIIPFSCAYPLETQTSLNNVIRPQLPQGGLMGSGAAARAYMKLFHDSNYSYSYPPGPVTLPVGSGLHVQVYVYESDPSFAVVLEDCYTTYSSNPDDPMRYYLIHNRCPTDPHVSVVENGLSLRARFCTLFTPPLGGNPDIYLHCRLCLCDKSSQSCAPFCGRRTYRSVDNSAQINSVSIGPITYL